jgi:hypothetical protein
MEMGDGLNHVIWGAGAAIFALAGSLLLIAATSPMTPLDLMMYGLAFAVGAFALGVAGLVIFACLLILLGTRNR